MSTGFAAGEKVYAGGALAEIVDIGYFRAHVRVLSGLRAGVILNVALAELERPTELRIGSYTIRLLPEGLWLAHSDGEAMQTTEAKLEAALDRFWKEEF